MGSHAARHEVARAIAHEARNLARMPPGQTHGEERGVGAGGEVFARIDQRAVEVEDPEGQGRISVKGVSDQPRPWPISGSPVPTACSTASMTSEVFRPVAARWWMPG